MPSYDQFAPHFDAWQAAFGGAYDALILPRLLAALERFAPEAHRIADLGIGTGDLVVALAERGYEVIGVDVSRPMLAVATGKVAARGIHPVTTLLEQDIRELRLDPPVDACLCVYTVVNQLVGDGDLGRLFEGVHRSLVEDGLFVFEVNLPAAYARWWTGEDEVLGLDLSQHGEDGYNLDLDLGSARGSGGGYASPSYALSGEPAIEKGN